MDVKNKKKKERIGSVIGSFFAAMWFGFWVYCYETAPRYQMEEAGRIYQLNYHGTIPYLNKWEYFTFYGIPICFILFGIASYIFLKLKK